MSLKYILKNKKVIIITIPSFILVISIIILFFILQNRQLEISTNNGNINNINDEETVSTSDKSEIVQTSTTSYTYGEDCIYYETEKGYITNTYEDNDKVRILLKNSSKHFTFEFQTDDKELDEFDKTFILANLENQYCRFKLIFKQDSKQLIKIILHYSETDSLNASSYEGSWSGLTWYPNIDIFHKPTSYTDYTKERYEKQANVLSHELVHIFQFDITECHISSWYVEGMAVSYAEPNLWQSWEIQESKNNNQQIPATIIERIKNEFPTLNDLNTKIVSTLYEDRIIAYDSAHLFYSYLNDLYGEEKMIDFLLNGISEDCSDYYTSDGLNTDFKMYFDEEISDVYRAWVNSL